MRYYCNSTAVQGINQAPPLENQYNATLVDGERWGISKSTMCRKQRILSAPNCTRHQALRGVRCDHAPDSMVFPNIRSSSQLRQPRVSLMTGQIQTSLAVEKQKSTAVCMSYCFYLTRENNILRTPFCQKTHQIATSRSKTKTSPQSNARHVSKNEQARRQP